jgi:hypothetical protein
MGGYTKIISRAVNNSENQSGCGTSWTPKWGKQMTISDISFQLAILTEETGCEIQPNREREMVNIRCSSQIGHGTPAPMAGFSMFFHGFSMLGFPKWFKCPTWGPGVPVFGDGQPPWCYDVDPEESEALKPHHPYGLK